MTRVAIACILIALVSIMAACVEESEVGDASGRSAEVLSTLAAAAATPTPEPTPVPPSPTATHTAEPAPTFTPTPVENTATPSSTPTAEPAATFTPSQVENTATATPADTPTETPPTPTAEPDEPQMVVGTEVGDTAPGFVLASAAGPEFALESLRGERSVVVVFYRSFW